MSNANEARPLAAKASEATYWPDRRTMMPDKRTAEKARKDKRAGKAPTTQAGEFVREEIDKIRHGEHGARSPEQAIAIGLSKARRAGVALRPPRKGKAKASTRKSVRPPNVLPRQRRRCERRALPAARQRPVRQLGPERATKHSVRCWRNHG
jgi:hypothetical protein